MLLMWVKPFVVNLYTEKRDLIHRVDAGEAEIVTWEDPDIKWFWGSKRLAAVIPLAKVWVYKAKIPYSFLFTSISINETKT